LSLIRRRSVIVCILQFFRPFLPPPVDAPPILLLPPSSWLSPGANPFAQASLVLSLSYRSIRHLASHLIHQLGGSGYMEVNVWLISIIALYHGVSDGDDAIPVIDRWNVATNVFVMLC